MHGAFRADGEVVEKRDRYEWMALAIVLTMALVLLVAVAFARGLVIAGAIFPAVVAYCWYMRRLLAARLRSR